MRQNKTRIFALFLAIVFCLSTLRMTVFAEPDDETTAPAETVPADQTLLEPAPETPVPEEPVVPAETGVPTELEQTEPASEPVSEPSLDRNPAEEPQQDAEKRGMLRFTPDGVLTLIDDFEYVGLDENGDLLSKQFITVQDRSGIFFYIIIDRTGDAENVYFLNQVDLSDLKILAGNNQQASQAAACTCTDKCTVGHIDTSCPVCSVNLSECAARETVPSQTEPKLSEPGEPEKPSEENGKTGVNPVLVIVLITAMAGILIFYAVRFKKKRSSRISDIEFEDDDEFEDEAADREEDPEEE